MKVYVIIGTAYDEAAVFGVYDNKDAAEKRKQSLKLNHYLPYGYEVIECELNRNIPFDEMKEKLFYLMS